MKKMFSRLLIYILVLSCTLSLISVSAHGAEKTRVEEILESMTLRQKITQTFMVDFRKWDTNLNDSTGAQDFTVMNDQVRKVVEDYDFGAVIFFANNIKETPQALELSMAMQQAATRKGGIPLIISADQEGGSVYRLGSGTALPGNMALGAAGDTEYSYEAGRIIGSELISVGINTNLAPVVDVNNNANNPVIGLRSYGDDARQVGLLASASVSGMAKYNVIGCAKHFPGHGDTATDSHYGLPSVNKSRDQLLENELLPYQVLIDQGIEMIMTAHILYPQLDSSKLYSSKTGEYESLPATMSHDILTGLLKEEMGFEGIICTDSMRMAAISDTWTPAESIVNALNAGADMFCTPCTLYDLQDLKNLDAIIDGVEKAVKNGKLPESRLDDAVLRILTVKENRGILDYDPNDYSLRKALNTVGSEENRQTEREISAAAVTVVTNENGTLPLKLTESSRVLLLCPYDNERAQLVMGWNRAAEAGLIPDGAQMQYHRFSSEKLTSAIKTKLDWADTVIVISEVSSAARMTYDHWLSAGPNNFVNYAEDQGKTTVVMSADKPYDVQLYPGADAIIAVYGCKGSTVDPTEAMNSGSTTSDAAYGPNIIAGIEVSLGVFAAQGKLPVDIPQFDNTTDSYTDTIAYPRGHGITYDSLTPSDTPSSLLMKLRSFLDTILK